MDRMRICVTVAVAIAVTTMAGVAAAATAPRDPGVLNGVYHISWTEKDLLARCVAVRYAHSTYGVTTLTLRDGRFLWHPASHPPDCRNGRYTVTGHRFFIDFRGTGCYGTVTATWSLADAQLRLHVLSSTPARDTPSDRVFFGGKPWKKSG